MPIYTIANTKTKKREDIICSYDELREMLAKHPELVHEIKPIVTVTETSAVGGTLKKAGDGWNDLLKSIKATSDKKLTTIRTR